MSTPTPSQSLSSSSSDNNNGQVLNYTALVVALVALVVSSLQLVLQYVLSAESRSRCSSAAIGPWAKRNRQYWEVWKAKLSIKYVRPIISREQVFRAMKIQGTIHQKNLDALTNFKVEQKAPYNETLYGIQPRGNPELVLTRRGTEETAPTLVNTLRGREREAAESLIHNMRRLFSPTAPTKATWCTILCDLGLDIKTLPDSGDYIDAETIPSGLEAPPMQIRMSDLIQLGLLLDMAIVEVDELKRVVNMTGRHCSLISNYKDSVGMVSRYSGMAYDALPYVRRIDHMEARMLCDTADGMIYIGDCMTLISSWGFNSVDATFKQALRNCQDNRWQDAQVDDVVRSAQADGPHNFGGKWATPPTPIIGLLMAVCGNAAVANAFPHAAINDWTDEAKSSVLREVSDAIEERVGFTVAPDDIFQRIWDSNSDIIIMDEYKTASNYGCQLGGIRGWLCTNLAEFTLRVSRLWKAEPNTGDYHPVPIIPQLRSLVTTGALSKEWREDHQALEGTKKSWRLPATAMLWFQITLLDTWLARHVDIIIGETAMPELSVPAEIKAAELCAKATTVLEQSTGWNPPRLRFCRLYLAKLANGKVGPSFMSNTRHRDRTTGWNQMPIGSPEQWLIIDAVLSLRAALMHTRYMLMKDSSPLLSMKFDPMLLLA